MNAETERAFERLIVERGLVTPDQVAAARRAQGESAGAFGTLLEVLVEKGYGDRTKLREAAHLAAIRSGAERVSIADFELLEKIGQGGMGAVYRANQTRMGRLVALKLMKPKLAKDRRYLERFLREARASAKLSHPHIVQGIDAGQDKGYYYFAMELVDGEAFRQTIRRAGRVPEPRCVEIGAQVARALEHAHKFGMVHRDVKPENILIERDTGAAKLADLGLVKSSAPTDTSVTQTGEALGTPNYISPEQARGDEEVDIRSDIYSLGATLYHAATGTLPFDGESAPILMSQHMSAPLDPPHQRRPEVSVRFSRVIQKMMAKKRDDRYQTPAELIADLERVARGEQPGALQPATRRRRRAEGAAAFRRPKLAAAVIGVSLAATLMLVIILAYAMSPREQQDNEEHTRPEVYYSRAAKSAPDNPAELDGIIEDLGKYLELEPNGANATKAQALLSAAKSFRSLARNADRDPASWKAAVKGLKRLAARAPKDPPCADGIYEYIRRTNSGLIQYAMRDAAVDPINVPQALQWLDAVVATAQSRDIKKQARSKRPELDGLLRENAHYILDKFAAKAEKITEEKGNFAEAIALLRSSVPEELRTARLGELLGQKIESMRKAAARRFETRLQAVWGLLDGGALGRARDLAAHAKQNLSIPRLERPIETLCRTVDAAERFLPLFKKLGDLERAKKKDEKAIAHAALGIQEGFGKLAYVERRLTKYQPGIRRLVGERMIEKKLAAAAGLVGQKKDIAADALITEVLRHPALTKTQRRRAVELRMKLGTVYGLARLMAAELKSRLPVDNVKLRLKGDPRPLDYKITAASTDSISLERGGNTHRIKWGLLGYEVLHELALGKLGLISEKDPNGLYYLGRCCFDGDNKESKRLLEAAVELARKRTDAELPGRAALISSAEAILAEMAERRAEDALKRLTVAVKAPRSAAQLDRAIAAWESFKRKHADTRHAKKNAKALKTIAANLSDAIKRVRTAFLKQAIAKSEWPRIATKLQEVLDETDKISPLPAESRKTVQSLIGFGEAFVAEAIIYGEVFSARPWRNLRILPLMRHPDKRVAERAKQYSKIFDVADIDCKENAGRQRIYAVRVKGDDDKWHAVTDVNVRLARFNSVFTYFVRKERGQCTWAEIEAAREFRHTGGTGDMMAIIMMEQLVKPRRKVSKELQGFAQEVRLQAYIRCARQAPVLRKHVIQQAKAFMREFRDGDHPARFCLIAAEQYEADGDDDNALKYFKTIIGFRTRWKHYAWHGHLGSGRIRERRKKYISALFDYEAALRRSTDWPSGYACARAIADLCVHSGKLDRRANAERAVNKVLERTESPPIRERIRKLLEKK